MAEQKIVEIVRDILIKKGYPSPSKCDEYDENGLKTYAQDDYKKNEELNNLFLHASKCGKNNELLWSEKADCGKPEFTIINEHKNLAVVIECKPAKKSNLNISPALRDENILVKKADTISKYAIDGALHYAKFLSKVYDVIAIGISGIENSNELNISTYYWKKEQSLQYGENEKYSFCYGPFYNLKIDNLCSYKFYERFINSESKEIIKKFNEEKAMDAATNLNIKLDSAGVNVTTRALLVSGLLLALRDKSFQKTYSDKEIKSEELQTNLSMAIIRVIDSTDIEDEYKKKVLKDKFQDTFNQRELLANNAEKLRLVLEILYEDVYPCINGEYSIDIIGKFYHEFLRYAKNGNNNGIKLTPSMVTELFCDLVDLKVTDTVMDPCLGTRRIFDFCYE